MANAHYTPRWIVVWKRNLLVWTKLLGPAILGNFGEPLLYLLGLGFGLGAFVGNVQEIPYIVFLASGIVCSSAMFAATFEGLYSAYTRMAVQQTWNAMLAAPLDIRDVVIGEAVWAGTKSLFSSTAILLVALALGAVTNWAALAVVPVALLTGICYASMALVITSFARNYDFFLYYNTLFMTPTLLFSGVFFPLETMPSLIQQAATALPLYHAISLVRPLMTDQPVQQIGAHLIVIGIWGLCSLWLAIHLVKKRLTS